MEVTKVVRRGEEGTSVNQDAESWSKLLPEICGMILEKLPCMERLRLRVVCKDWNRSALQRVERKPFFVTILRRSPGSSQYLNGLVVYDVVSKSLSIKPLPFKLRRTCHGYFHSVPFAVQGLIFINEPMAPLESKLLSDACVVDVGKNHWCVYNIHTGTMHLLPQAPGCRNRLDEYFCGMMVDTSIKPHTFKLVVSNIGTGEKSQIYDSATRSWSSHPMSKPNSNSSLLRPIGYNDWYCMCHKGCMHMSSWRAVDGVFVYSMEEDQWSKLSGSPSRGEKRPFMGAWDDRIFAVLHDAGAKSVTVWELIDATLQKWVEFACCSKAQYEHLIEHDKCFDYCKCCTCEIVSVFSEEYVLMYNWHLGRSYGQVLLNLKTKEWEQVARIPNMSDVTRDEEWKNDFCDC